MIHHPTPLLDLHWEGYELAADDTHRYVWIYQGWNLRLIAIPHGEEGLNSWDYGWCYPRDPEALAEAVKAWDPATQDEPTGWHKRPSVPRRAPLRAQDEHYNRPRCCHGDYIADGCRTYNCPDHERTAR